LLPALLQLLLEPLSLLPPPLFFFFFFPSLLLLETRRLDPPW
jgi:hypothetical protein